MKTHLFSPQQRFIYHSSGWDEIYGSFIISRWVLGKFVSKDFVVQLPNFIFYCTGKASYEKMTKLYHFWILPGENSEILQAKWPRISFICPLTSTQSGIVDTVNRGWRFIGIFWTNRGKLGDSLGLVWVVVLGLVEWLGEDFISRVCAKQFVEKFSRIRISKNPTFKSTIVCERRGGMILIVSDH